MLGHLDARAATPQELEALIAEAKAQELRLLVVVLPAEQRDLGLSAEQQRAVEIRASGCTLKVTAQRLGIHKSTLHRWMKGKRNFQAAMKAAAAS